MKSTNNYNLNIKEYVIYFISNTIFFLLQIVLLEKIYNEVNIKGLFLINSIFVVLLIIFLLISISLFVICVDRVIHLYKNNHTEDIFGYIYYPSIDMFLTTNCVGTMLILIINKSLS